MKENFKPDFSEELDIFAVDAGGRRYNLEVQRTNTGAKPKRARYYGSILDANALKPGDNYINLPETYVIFITEKDVLGDGLPIYEIDRYVGQNQRYFGDEEHIIYVNGQYRDDTPLGWLMHVFSCTRPEDMHYKQLADRILERAGKSKTTSK